jgi:hypothetical protein
VRTISSSVILNFSRVLRPRKVSREKVLQIRGRRPIICNVLEIHFSWPEYPGKIQEQNVQTVKGQDNHGNRIFF